eukprot:701852-Pleurochrysis_carterae.AAC.1
MDWTARRIESQSRISKHIQITDSESPTQGGARTPTMTMAKVFRRKAALVCAGLAKRMQFRF